MLAGKRTAQSVFFTAETGGKFGELQLENEDYSLFQKALTSYLYGTAATYAETLGSIRLVSGGRNISKNIGTKAARKEFYTRPSRFGFNVVGATLKGLKTLPKGLAIEQIEETATQLSHNYFDIVVLNKDKSLIDGLNKDFFANVAVTSFGIMSPTTSGNIINGIKNEFRTRSEILNNQKLTKELISLTEAPATADSRVRKREILEELALSDAISLHKLRYMSASDIERVADLNRQMRHLQGQMNMLGKTGERSETAKRRKAEIKTEYDKLVTAQQEILNSKERSLKEREKNLNESLGVAAQNTEAAYWLGVNDFYNEIAMTQMGDGDYVSIEGELQEDGTINYTNLDEQISKYKGATIEVDGEQVDRFDYIKSQIESGYFYGVRVGKDIIINQPLINARIGVAPTSKEAQWAAVTPLEELFHISVAGKKVKFDGDAEAAINEVQSVLDEKLELKQISKETYKDFTDRLKLYTDKNGVDVEEFIAQLNNMVALGDINLSNIDEAPSLKTFLNNTIRNTFGDMSWMLNLKTSGDVFNLIKNFRSDVDKQVMQTTPEDEEVKDSRVYQEVEAFKDDLVNQQSKDATAFLIADKLQNEVDRRLKIDVDPETREDIVRNFLFDDRRGLLGLLKNYSPARNESIMGYLNSTTPGGKLLDARLIEFYQDDPRYNQIIQSTTDEAVQRKTERVTSEDITETTTEDVTDKPLAKKPTETIVYSDEILSNVGAANTEALEARITEEIQTAFKGKDISRFKELKDIPENITQLYADMFGLSTVEGIVDFKRNFPKLDEDAVRKIRTFLSRNAEDDFRRFPKTKDDKKRATGVKQTKLGKVMYDANDNFVGTLKQYKDILQGKNITLPAYDGTMVEFNRLDQSGKKLPLYRDSQHYKAALKFHIQNRIAEDVIPDKAQRLSAGLKFSKAKQQPKTVAKPMFSKAMRTLFDLQLPGRLKVDSLLDRLKLDKTLNLKELVLTPEGRKQIVDTFRDEIFILLPKEAWQQRDSFTSTGKNYGVSMSQGTVEEIAGYNQLKEDLSKAIDAAPDAAFGAPVLDKDGNVVNFKISGYATVFKGTRAEIKNKALEFNRKVTSIHETMWDRIAERINEDKSRASAIATYLKLTANDKSSWHRRGAAIFGYSPNPAGIGKTKYEMEHAMPATAAYLYLLDSAIQNAGRDESNFKDAYKLVTDNYKLIALDKAENKKLGAAGLGTAMPKGWDVLKNFWWQRYFNPQVVLKDGGIDPSLIVDLDGKHFKMYLI